MADDLRLYLRNSAQAHDSIRRMIWRLYASRLKNINAKLIWIHSFDNHQDSKNFVIYSVIAEVHIRT